MPKHRTAASEAASACGPVMLRHLSPLRYPGGKGRFLRFLQKVLVENALVGCHYAEPYAGGAGLALGLLRSGHASAIHINDLDRSIYAFWYSALNHTEALCKLIRRCPLTVEYWKQQRTVQKTKATSDLLDLGFSTFYLNRTNRSGIIWGGGPIGGLEQESKWGIDARFNRDSLVQRILYLASQRSRISLSNLDALDFIALMAGELPEGSLAYLDPPYYMAGRPKLYANDYDRADHARIAELLPCCPWPWIVSYGTVPEILRLYHRQRRLRYEIGYTAAERYDGAEVMFFSGDLTIPAVESPLGVRAAA